MRPLDHHGMLHGRAGICIDLPVEKSDMIQSTPVEVTLNVVSNSVAISGACELGAELPKTAKEMVGNPFL